MKLEDIKKAIGKSGESGTVELKKSTANLKSAAQTLCAFLNGQGGTVFIGIGNDHKVIGQVVNDKTKLDISNTLKKFEPTANIEVEYIDVGKGRQVIAMTAHPDSHCVPYSFSGCAYERQQADAHVGTIRELRRRLTLLEIDAIKMAKVISYEYELEPGLTEKYTDQHPKEGDHLTFAGRCTFCGERLDLSNPEIYREFGDRGAYGPCGSRKPC